jgi:purine-binding chemotaxis protein CheW
MDRRPGSALLVFELAGQQYALPVTQVREVLPLAALTRIAEAPGALAGVLRLRGSLLPVVDLRRRLGLPAVAPRVSQRIVVALAASSAVGLVVDSAHGLLELSELPETAAPDRSQLVRTVVLADGRVVTILDLEAAIGAEVAGFLSRIVEERSRPRLGDVHARHLPEPAR